jgi:hypothetical protein
VSTHLIEFSILNFKFLSFISASGTKSSRYCGHFWPIVQAPDDR